MTIFLQVSYKFNCNILVNDFARGELLKVLNVQYFRFPLSSAVDVTPQNSHSGKRKDLDRLSNDSCYISVIKVISYSFCIYCIY